PSGLEAALTNQFVLEPGARSLMFDYCRAQAGNSQISRVVAMSPDQAPRFVCLGIGRKDMPLFGAHMSIAGGYHNAVLAARSHGCEALQLFTKNSNQWAAKELTDEEARLFRRALRGSGIRVTMAHDSYLINLASPDAELYRRSVEAFVVEVQRAERL